MTTFVPCTFRQFCQRTRDAKRAEYSLTVAETTDYYPDHVLRPTWMEAMTAHAKAGGDFPPSLVRTLSDDERYWINKFGYSTNRALLADGRTL